MNRRDALQKLAAGGAIALGGSQVLASNAVAATVSGNVPDDFPDPGETLQPTVTTTGFPVKVDFAAPAFLACSEQGTPTTTYRWRIESYSVAPFLGAFTQLRIINPNGSPVVAGTTSTASCSGGCGNGAQYFSSLGPSVRLERRFVFGGIFAFDGSFQQGDEVVIDLEVTTQCPGGPTIVAEYRYNSANGLNSAMDERSYTVTPPPLP